MIESEISVLLSDLKRAYQLLKEVAPTIKQALDISDISHENLSGLILDLESSITDLEG